MKEFFFFWAGLRKPFGGDGFQSCHCQASAPGSQQDGSHTARAQGFEDKEGADSGEEHRVANRGGVQVGGDGAGANNASLKDAPAYARSRGVTYKDWCFDLEDP